MQMLAWILHCCKDSGWAESVSNLNKNEININCVEHSFTDSRHINN